CSVIEFESLFARMEPLGADRSEADLLFREHRGEMDLYRFRLAPAHGDPRIGGDETVCIGVGYGHHVGATFDGGLDLIGGDRASQTCAQYHDQRLAHLRSFLISMTL